MKSDFLIALTQLAAEKNLPREVVITAIEAALVSAYRKDNFATNQNISVKIDPSSGKVEVWAEKVVTAKPTDSRREISSAEARKIKSDAKIDDVLMVEATPHDAGRIAAQTAKQVILQRLHEAEHSAIFEEYANKGGDIVTGVVQRIDPGQIYVDLGRTEGILPAAEQVRTERYRPGQRVKVLVLQVAQTTKGPRVILSRSHPDMLRRLFELEIPEVFSGTVEIKSISREAGFRSKVAVAARQEGIDPVGCCVGLRGIRIQNIVNELNNEKIDVVMWSPNMPTFVANALSPAHIVGVELNKEQQVATVVVPDKQLSLAIGKEGQNARLAAKLTGWRIDIKSTSMAEAEKLAAKPQTEVTTETKAVSEEEKEPVAEATPEEVAAEAAPVPVSAEAPAAEEEGEALPPLEGEFVPVASRLEQKPGREKAGLRFAEDILVSRPAKSEVKIDKTKKKKKAKKGGHAAEGTEEGARVKKGRRGVEVIDEEEEYDQ